MKSLAFALLYVWSIFALFPGGTGAQETKVYTLAIVPQAQAVSLAQKWTPFVQKLSQESGVTIQIKMYYATIPQFESDIMNGVPDFAYMNPYHITMVHKTQKYIPLIRDKDPLVGILVAHKNTGINFIRDVEGKEIVFPAPNAFGASLYMRALLSKQEKIQFRPRYVQTHDNVYRHVLLDKAAAGGGVLDTFNAQPEEIKNQLKIIYQTPPTVSHPFAAHPRVPAAVRKKVVDAIFKMAGDKANKELFEKIEIDKPIAANYEEDYAPLAHLGLEKFVVAE
jgi:phosphonate transport system substrate-binding protein